MRRAEEQRRVKLLIFYIFFIFDLFFKIFICWPYLGTVYYPVIISLEEYEDVRQSSVPDFSKIKFSTTKSEDT